MPLFKRGATWWVDIAAPNGKRIRKSAGTADRKLAQEYHDRLKVELWQVHKLGEKPRRTWEEASVQWLKEKAHKRTIDGDKGILRWLDPFLGGKYLDEITRELLVDIGESKLAQTSTGTANRTLALVRSILRIARNEWEWIDKVPHVRLYPESNRRVRWLTAEEAARLIKELPPHLADMAAFSLATGLRQKNVSFLKWDEVSLERGTAWVHADQSKTRRAIAVPLNQDALRVLKKRLGRHPEYVFTFRGKPVDQTSTQAWRKALKRAGIEDFRWHDLRHTWASWHVQNGTSLQELMELGGWTTMLMVQRYAHLGGEHLKAAADRISGTISSQPHQFGALKLVVSN